MRIILERIEQIRSAELEKIEQETAAGKLLVAYSSSFIPEAFIRGAGANTYLLARGGEAAVAEAALPYTLSCINPMARANVCYAIKGYDRFASSAGLIVVAILDNHSSRMAELLEYKGHKLFKVGVPTDWKKDISFSYYRRSLRHMLAEIEKLTGKAADMEAIRHIFERSNRINGLFRRINCLRAGSRVPISNEDYVRLQHLSITVQSDELVPVLEEAVEKLEHAGPVFEADAPRLLMMGRAIAVGDYAVVRLIDSAGCPVVAEVFDECSRVLDCDIQTTGDLLDNFAANRYRERLPVDVFQPSWKQRFSKLKELLEEYKVDGVIWYQLEFDEIYDMEFSCIRKWLGEMGVPVAKIETNYDYSAEKLSSIKTTLNSLVKAAKKQRNQKRRA